MKTLLLPSFVFLLQASSLISSEYRYSRTNKNQTGPSFSSYMPTKKIIAGRNHLHHAAADKYQFKDIPQYIAEENNVNQQDNNGDTPAHVMAATSLNLIDYGPKSDWTALADIHNKKMIKPLLQNLNALLSAGANVSIRNNNNETAIDIANNSKLVTKYGCYEVVKLLQGFMSKK